MLFLHALVLFIIFVCLIYYYFTRNFKYWESRNIRGPRPLPFFGNIKDFVLRKSNAAVLNKQFYDKYPNEKVVGIFRMTSPTLIIRDLDVAKNVLIKDFEYFEDRGLELSKEGLGANLFHADSEIWRPLRTFFSPLFTTAKLKNMIPLIVEKSDATINHFKKITELQKDQDVYSLVQKFTMSSILTCAFGLDIAVDSEILLQRMMKIDQLSFSRTIANDCDLLYPGVLKIINASVFPKEVSKFFLDLVEDIIQARNGIPSDRKDFIDLILEAKNQGTILETKKNDDVGSTVKCVKLTNEVIAAQAFIFYTAGYETNATTMAYMMYELAMNPQIQEKLIAEVDQVVHRHNGKITYEMINELSYMEKVLNETLRKYPVIDVQRRAKANYNIPGTNIVIAKGTIIIVPTLGISQDEKYYPNPTKFDPERFSPENDSKRHPCAFIPFGVGPRYCIGMMFARIQSRVFLMKLLSNFRVETSKNTQSTIVFNPGRVVTAPKDGIYLNLIPRKSQYDTKNK
ncbi:cytochrome P450 6B1-like [Maniola hyperantus]|uniref:cytochrome P450 6B1-like n=1 Tax=Aphantopus hyperantus TaxID=2795564 RepID=UPI00156860FD|nr:cytochrome P450 6B1-like [Maniola hyperantus]